MSREGRGDEGGGERGEGRRGEQRGEKGGGVRRERVKLTSKSKQKLVNPVCINYRLFSTKHKELMSS